MNVTAHRSIGPAPLPIPIRSPMLRVSLGPSPRRSICPPVH